MASFVICVRLGVPRFILQRDPGLIEVKFAGDISRVHVHYVCIEHSFCLCFIVETKLSAEVLVFGRDEIGGVAILLS